LVTVGAALEVIDLTELVGHVDLDALARGIDSIPVSPVPLGR
jgi:hypothetical protein